MKIALTQMDIVWENEEENIKKYESLMRSAKEKGADMVVFPEMTLTGFSMNIEETAKEDINDKYIQRMINLSREYGIVSVFGFVLKYGSKAKNCMIIADRGEVKMYYEKIHPFTYGKEGDFFIGGDEIASCRINGVNIGGFICYDLRFGEVFSISSEKNTVIIVIANWPEERAEHWELLLKARALENQCYVIGVNRIGEGGGLMYKESSMAFSPYGERITETLSGEGIIVADVDELEAVEYRKDFPVKMDRRKKLYAKKL